MQTISDLNIFKPVIYSGNDTFRADHFKCDYFNINKPVIARTILLAREMGLVLSDEIALCASGKNDYVIDLFRKCRESIASKLTTVMDDISSPLTKNHHFKVGIFFRMRNDGPVIDIGLKKNVGVRLDFANESKLARSMVCGSINWISEFFDSCITLPLWLFTDPSPTVSEISVLLKQKSSNRHLDWDQFAKKMIQKRAYKSWSLMTEEDLSYRLQNLFSCYEDKLQSWSLTMMGMDEIEGLMDKSKNEFKDERWLIFIKSTIDLYRKYSDSDSELLKNTFQSYDNYSSWGLYDGVIFDEDNEHYTEEEIHHGYDGFFRDLKNGFLIWSGPEFYLTKDMKDDSTLNSMIRGLLVRERAPYRQRNWAKFSPNGYDNMAKLLVMQAEGFGLLNQLCEITGVFYV